MKIEKIVINHLLEIAKERQKEINHLDVGNYVAEHYIKIILVIQEMRKSKCNKNKILSTVDIVAQDQGVYGGCPHKAIKKALEDIL